MKRLTLALMSVTMLIFGMGSVSAQPTLGAPTPSSGSTVSPGTQIEFAIPGTTVEDAGMVYLLYTLNDAVTELETTYAELQMGMETMFAGMPFKVALGMDDMEGGVEWMLPVTVSGSGSVTLRARLAVPVTGGDTGGDDDFGAGGGTLAYSDIVTATYTVEGETEKLLPPTFSPAAGEVEPKTEVAISSGYDEEDIYSYYICYVIDGDDAALEINSLYDLYSGDIQMYESPIRIVKAQTIKARTVKINGMSQTIDAMSDIATASYTVIGGDQEDLSVPKLTLSGTEIEIAEKGGSAVFSCTLNMQEYEKSTKLGFAIDPERSVKGSIAKLEYQTGAAVDEAAWQEWPAKDWGNFGAQFIAADPGNTDDQDSRLLSVTKNGVRTVHYRLTLAQTDGDLEAPMLSFVAVPASVYGYWSNTEDPVARATVNFIVPVTAPVLTFAPTTETGLTLVSGASTELWIRPENKDRNTEIYYRILTADDADQNAPISESDTKVAYSTLGGGDWVPIKVTESMVKDGKFIIKAAARQGGRFFEAVTKTYEVEIMKEEFPATVAIDPMPTEFMIGETYTLTIRVTADEKTVEENKNTFVNLTISPVEIGIPFEKVEYRFGEAGDFTALDEDLINDLMDIELGTFGSFTNSGVIQVRMVMAREKKGDAEVLKIGVTSGYSFMDAKSLAVTTINAPCVARAAADPTFSPAPGCVTKGTAVTLACETAGAEIRYTLDGTEPTAQSLKYENPIVINQLTSIKAVAVKDGKTSFVATGDYSLVGIPQGMPASGKVVVDSLVTITLSENTPDTKIYYTLDGTEPTVQSTEYTAPFKLRARTLKVVAVSGEDQSPVITREYVLVPAKPQMSVAAGKVAFDTEVTIACATEGTEIYWSFGSNEPVSKTEGTLYDGQPIKLKLSGILKAIAYYEGVEGDPVSVRYTVGLSAPKFDLASGAVPAGARVKITSESKEANTNPNKLFHIVYTVDGSEPSKDNGTEYTSPIEITEAVTIKAITWAMGVSGIEKSEVSEASYTIETTSGGDDPAVPDTVAMPTFSVPAGEVEKDTEVTIACATEGAKIYYTVDGSEPTAQSIEYKEAVVIDKSLTLKAIAVKEEMVDSKVTEAAYTVKDVANEELELAGVSVYPNPSNGVFNLELPVSVTVEVFASNGVLRQRLETGAGVVTLNIERSGIYFLRITGEGRTTVKRVVVR